MARTVSIVLVLLVAAVALRQSPTVRSAPPVERRAGLSFDPSVDGPSHALIESAVASARPEAKPLIDAVAGLVDIRVAQPTDHALGTTQRQADGRYELILDLGTTLRATGPRGVTRMVLHELGHVVDGELVSDDLRRELDADIPARPDQVIPVPERFAETFAKWAMGNDLGATIYSGYAVAPPRHGFDAWASRLVSGLPAGSGTAAP